MPSWYVSSRSIKPPCARVWSALSVFSLSLLWALTTIHHAPPLAFSPSLCANPPALLPPVCERVCACVSSPWFRSFPFVCFLPVLSVVHRYAYARTHTREHVYACTCISLRPHPTLRTRNFSYTSSKKTRRHLFLSLFGCCLPPHPNPHPLSVPAYPASSVSTHNSLLSSSTFSGAPTAPSHMSSLCARVRAWYIGAEGEEEGGP